MPNILHAPELLAARESAIYQKYVSPVITYGKEYVILEKEKNSGYKRTTTRFAGDRKRRSV